MHKLPILALLAILLLYLPNAHSQSCKKYTCNTYTSYNQNGMSCLNESTTSARAGYVDIWTGMCSAFYPNSKGAAQCIYQTAYATTTATVKTIAGVCQPNNMSGVSYSWLPRYPGEWCDTLGSKYQCVTGYRRCVYNRCQGYVKGELCTWDGDCDPGLYCNSGTCDYVLNASSPCTTQSSCGRDMYCLAYDFNSSSTLKRCVSYFSQPDGTRVVPNDGLTVMEDKHHWLCASGAGYDKNISSPKYGLCGNALYSSKFGQACGSGVTCTVNSTVTTDTASCNCTYDSTGIAVCGIERQNAEWVAATTAVRSFLANTKDCHIARPLLDTCDVPADFNAMMCLYSKAKYYHANKNPLSCLTSLSNPWLYPELAASNSYCTWTYGAMLKVGSLSLFAFLAAILTFTQ